MGIEITEFEGLSDDAPKRESAGWTAKVLEQLKTDEALSKQEIAEAISAEVKQIQPSLNSLVKENKAVRKYDGKTAYYLGVE